VEIQRILCPSDFSEASAHAVDLAIALAESSEARIVGLHAVSPLTSSVETTAMDECRGRMRAFFEPATVFPPCLTSRYRLIFRAFADPWRSVQKRQRR
jgi:hypothetical protein